MSKNFLEQLLDLAGLKLPDEKGHYSPSVYRDEPVMEENINKQAGTPPQEATTGAKQSTSKLTGVDKYLSKKYPEPQEKEAPIGVMGTAELTGVAKYLAKKQQAEQKQTEAELAHMTGVARYLAKLDSAGRIAPKSAPPVSTVKENTKNMTRVEKYLAGQKQTISPVSHSQPAKSVEAAPKPSVAAKEPAVEKQQAPTATVTKKQPAPPAAKAPSKLINLAEDATQCQAATLKGTQCRRTSNLEKLEKTIHGQKYKFAVCSQHNNKDFTPMPSLVSNG